MTAETGFLGLVSFLWVLFTVFRHGVMGSFHIHDPWALTILQGLVCGLFGFLVQSFFDNTFYTVQLGMLMWIIVGMVMSVIRINPR